MRRQVYSVTVTIENGAAVSSGVEIGNAALVGVAMPAGWTAATVGVQASADGQTWLDVKDTSGTEYGLTADAGEYIIIPPDDLLGPRYLRLLSGSSDSPVQQEAERKLRLDLLEA